MIIKVDQKKKIRKKRNTFDSISAIYEGRELTLNAFKSGMFPIKATKGKGRLSNLTRVAHVAKVFDRTLLKILSSKQSSKDYQ